MPDSSEYTSTDQETKSIANDNQGSVNDQFGESIIDKRPTTLSLKKLQKAIGGSERSLGLTQLQQSIDRKISSPVIPEDSPEIPDSGTMQLRVEAPYGLGAASAAQVAGARVALNDTLSDIIRESLIAGTYFVEHVVNLDADPTTRMGQIEALSVNELIQNIHLVVQNYPEHVIDTSQFDYVPNAGTDAARYVRQLMDKTIALMEVAARRNSILRFVFGDGDMSSAASGAAAATAKDNIKQAIVRLEAAANNIYLDTSGVSEQVGVGGFAQFDQKIFLLVSDVTSEPSDDKVATLFHETMHLAHNNILDGVGYQSAGRRFYEASIANKLNNADHYAAVARIMDSGRELHEQRKFEPRLPQPAGQDAHGSGGTVALNIRSRYKHFMRLYWSGSMDLFLTAMELKKQDRNENALKKSLSEQLNMTYHNAGFFDRPAFTDTDMALAEATLNRIKRFTGTPIPQGAAVDVMLVERQLQADGGDDQRRDTVAMDLIVEYAESNNILKEEDMTPDARTKISRMMRDE